MSWTRTRTCEKTTGLGLGLGSSGLGLGLGLGSCRTCYKSAINLASASGSRDFRFIVFSWFLQWSSKRNFINTFKQLVESATTPWLGEDLNSIVNYPVSKVLFKQVIHIGLLHGTCSSFFLI